MSLSLASRSAQAICCGHIARASISISSSTSVTSALRSTPAHLSASPLNIRHSSTLPAYEDFKPRVYPFPVQLTTRLPMPIDISQKSLWKPSEVAQVKCNLQVDLRDLPFTSLTERDIFVQLCAGRVQPVFNGPRALHWKRYERAHLRKNLRNPWLVTFTSDTLPTAKYNENRAFDMLESCLDEAARLAQMFAKEDQRLAANRRVDITINSSAEESRKAEDEMDSVELDDPELEKQRKIRVALRERDDKVNAVTPMELRQPKYQTPQYRPIPKMGQDLEQRDTRPQQVIDQEIKDAQLAANPQLGQQEEAK